MDKNYETVRRIMLATNKIDGVYYYFARRMGINENTLAFLYALDDDKPHSQKEISEEWQIPRTTINTIVKNMMADGYITFDPGQHTKEKTILLTDNGRSYLDKLLEKVYLAEEQAIKATLEKFSSEFVTALEFFGERFTSELNKNIQEQKE